MSGLIVLFILPVLWSVVVQLARLAALRGRPVLADGAEKLILAVMLLPIAAGGVLLLVAPVITPLTGTPLLPAAALETAGTSVKASLHSAIALPAVGPTAINALLIAYVAVTLVLLVRTLVTVIRLHRIVSAAQAKGGILLTAAAVPAYAWGRRHIVVPARLHARLPAADMALIIAHERAHLARRDPAWFLMLSLVEAVMWINPLIRRQGRACRLAAELACDAAVVTAAPHLRHSYGRALISALKLNSGAAPSCVAAASSDRHTYSLRLDHIMTQTPRPPKAVVWIAALAVLLVPVAGAQLALAKAAPPAQAPGVVTQAASPAIVRPVDAPISAIFGVRDNPAKGEMKFHEGVDFAAPLGTPVKAHADGVVSFAGKRYGYGMTIEIDNGGDTTTRYAHLDTITVKAGDHVTAGQVIADIGQPLGGTAPHLHFELWRNHVAVDPAPIFAAVP